ncbi:hypothetical protein [Paracoccus tegillarcae]|uniref:hypothetical protein n=1 Tax=Paracoccus tegillarcae TaxID=1529068 RepID=UPI001300AB6B|nr:hypothetical protein [Paracoccus tegillarcae]
MTEIDPDLVKCFNLLASSSSFVIRLDVKSQKGTVSNPSSVPENDGDYLVHGTTKLASGTELESVFCVDTDSGGDLAAVYWQTKKGWMNSQDARLPAVLGVERHEIFPFGWKFSVPLENDTFHPAKL